MLKCYHTDLHIHTCLSPCGDLTMSPKRIVEKARDKMLNIIGICDHNSAENVQYTINAARTPHLNPLPAKTERKKNKGVVCRGSPPCCVADYPCPPLTVLPGMEICTKEEVHILGIFDEISAVLKLQERIYQTLPIEKNNPELFGEQIIANEFDEVEGYNDKMLIGASRLSIKEVVDEIHRLQGIAIASHIDRESFSIISQLGFIPDDLNFDALEISPNITIEEANRRFPEIRRFPLLKSSDAHFLEDIGRETTTFLLEEPNITEIRKALKGENGRAIIYE